MTPNDQNLVDAVAAAIDISSPNVTPIRDEQHMKGRPMASLYDPNAPVDRAPSVVTTADSHDKMSAALVRVCGDLQTLTFRDMMTLCNAVRNGLVGDHEVRGSMEPADVAGALLDAAESLHPPGSTKSVLR